MSEDKIREAIEAQITKLRLDGNQITDLTPLAGFTKLESLYLKGNRITDLTPLAGLRALHTLNLRENQISDDQKEMLKKALPNCEIEFEF